MHLSTASWRWASDGLAQGVWKFFSASAQSLKPKMFFSLIHSFKKFGFSAVRSAHSIFRCPGLAQDWYIFGNTAVSLPLNFMRSLRFLFLLLSGLSRNLPRSLLSVNPWAPTWPSWTPRHPWSVRRNSRSSLVSHRQYQLRHQPSIFYRHWKRPLRMCKIFGRRWH